MAKKLCGNCFSRYKGTVCPNCGYAENTDAKLSFALAAGTKLNGRYIVGKVLGTGGFGIIYLAYDEQDEKAVAIKEFFPGGTALRAENGITAEPMTTYHEDAYEAGLERFCSEAEIITKFSESSEILGVYDIFRENGTAYYAMEFVNGVSLKDYVDANGVISEGQAIYIAEKILPALAVLHRENTLHRDVCPDNIMLCANGAVRLIDFGAARVISDNSQSMTVILKPGFAPLEQYSRKGEQDGRTDIYSLGASLYFGLTGETPDDPITRLDNDSAFSNGLKGIYQPLAKVISRAAAIKPENRYPGARKMLSDILDCEIGLERFEEEKIQNAASRVPGHTRVRPRKKRYGIIAAVAGAVAAAALVFGVTAFNESRGPVMLRIGDAEYSSDLTELDLSEKGLYSEDISNLRKMKSLTVLNLNNNYIADLSCLSGLTQIEELYFNNNDVSDIGFMKSMNNIRKVSGEYNKVSDISPLAGKIGLEEVFFGNCKVKDITPLRDCGKLTKIGFNGCSIGDLEAMRGMTELEMVCLQKCGLKSIEPLSESKKLKYVYLGRNNISDLSPLKGCDIKELYVDNNDLSGHSDTFEGLTVNGFMYLLDNNMTWAEIAQVEKVVNGEYEIYYVG